MCSKNQLCFTILLRTISLATNWGTGLPEVIAAFFLLLDIYQETGTNSLVVKIFSFNTNLLTDLLMKEHL